MRKFLPAACLVLVAVFLCPDESAARGRRRRAVCYPSYGCPPMYYSPSYAYPPGCYPGVWYPGFRPLYMPRAVAPAWTITGAKGKVYRVINTGERGDFEHDRREPGALTGATDPDPDNTFHGKARRACKIAISDGPEKSFADLGALLDWLPKDADMKKLGIKRDVNSGRVAQEKFNVTVNAFVYALRKEADNDYHIILGSDASAQGARYLNVEVSGLPLAGPFKQKLTAVRGQFKDFFNKRDPKILQDAKVHYVKFDPPIPVRVSGSLFWDIEHVPPKTVGPNDHKPKTAWEIHPVTRIVFEP